MTYGHAEKLFATSLRHATKSRYVLSSMANIQATSKTDTIGTGTRGYWLKESLDRYGKMKNGSQGPTPGVRFIEVSPSESWLFI